MLVHDILKIRYSDDGYLINYPPHLISEEEMFDAFMNASGEGYFTDNYPYMLEAEQADNYNQLVLSIMSYIFLYEIFDEAIPDWVYSYMLGETISINNDKLDIHDLTVALNTPNVSDAFTDACSAACFSVSTAWIGNSQTNIIDLTKYDSDILTNDFIPKLQSIAVLNPVGEENTLYDVYVKNERKIYARPATMFGEPHVLKSLRLKSMTM